MYSMATARLGVKRSRRFAGAYMQPSSQLKKVTMSDNRITRSQTNTESQMAYLIFGPWAQQIKLKEGDMQGGCLASSFVRSLGLFARRFKLSILVPSWV